MIVYLDEINIDYSYKKLILELKSRNIKYNKSFGFITFKSKLNGLLCDISVFHKSDINYRIIVSGYNENNIKLEDEYLTKYGNLVLENGGYYLNLNDGDIFYYLNEESSLKNFYIKFNIAFHPEKKFSKTILLVLFLINLVLFSSIYLVLLYTSGFNYIELISAILLIVVFTALSFVTWYFLENRKTTDKRLIIDKIDVDNNYIKEYKLLTDFGNNKLDLKVKPVNVFIYDDYILFNVLFKNKPLTMKFKYSEITSIDKRSVTFKQDIKINLFQDLNNDIYSLFDILNDKRGSN